MADEAILIAETEIPINFTCADGAGIDKGTLLQLANPMTASASTGNRDDIAGIAFGEKIANDGRTKIAVYRRGIFRMRAAGTITAGDALSSSSTNNRVIRATNAATSSKTLGLALEDGSSGDWILVELNVGCNNYVYA